MAVGYGFSRDWLLLLPLRWRPVGDRGCVGQSQDARLDGFRPVLTLAVQLHLLQKGQGAEIQQQRR